MNDLLDLQKIELFAWLGEDELGSGEIGLKQAVVPAGTIPMVTTSRQHIEQFWQKAEQQAATYGKRIYLVRLSVAEVLRSTKAP